MQVSQFTYRVTYYCHRIDVTLNLVFMFYTKIRLRNYVDFVTEAKFVFAAIKHSGV